MTDDVYFHFGGRLEHRWWLVVGRREIRGQCSVVRLWLGRSAGIIAVDSIIRVELFPVPCTLRGDYVLLFRWRWQDGNERIQQIIDAAPVLGGNGEYFLHAQPMKLPGQGDLLVAIDFVDGD